MSSRQEIQYIDEDKCYFFKCPHCELAIQVDKNQVNCHIFVHGQIKSTGEQVNPHSSLEQCEYLIKNDLIHGCGKPFKFFRDDEDEISYADIWKYG